MIKKVISEYGGAVGTLVVLVLIIGLVAVIIGSDSNSVVGKAMSDLIANMQTTLTP
jgi:cytosine/uracil/thiamine/allantoin permease